MKQASWNELFPVRDEPFSLTPEVPAEPRGWRRLLWWEDLLTFLLLSVMTLAVVVSIDRANWVDGMPSLYPVAFLGLVMAALLARLPWRELLVHPWALLAGAAAALGQILSVVPGGSPVARYQELHARMGEWFGIAFHGGVSNDPLPFIVLIVPVTWLAAYLSAWAVFRWQNVWLALIPAGAVLLANVSGLPGQFSFSFVVFLFGGALLVTRMHLLERASGWRRGGTPYPPLLSLNVLHATFWAALVLLIAAWLLPQASASGPLESLWARATAPVTERTGELARLFAGVRTDRSVRVHSFSQILPFLEGAGQLPGTLALDVEVEPLDQTQYLRAQAYYVYTPAGWDSGRSHSAVLDELQVTSVDEELLDREAVSIRVIASGETGDTIFTVGQPRRVDRAASYDWWSVPGDILGVDAANGIDRGDVYESVGSVSVATEDNLRAAGRAYPGWVTVRYLQLPSDFPQSVSGLAAETAAGATNDYDRAVAIETYLRAIPYDLDMPAPPHGTDPIEYFLFEAKRGFFDYHASAMVVMLRSLDIPARLAVGYALRQDDRVAGSDRYVITEQSAFAWPEVYFPSYGWVEFNPTPSLPSFDRAGGSDGSASTDTTDEVPDLGLLPGLGLGELPAEPPAGGGTSSAGTGGGSHAGTILTAMLGALGAIAIAGVAALAYAWRRGLAGLPPGTRLWAQTVRLASWARLPLAPGQTPVEYARTVAAHVPAASDAELLARSYVRQRYGRREIDAPERDRLEAAWRAVRWPLIRRLLRLA